MDRSKMISQLEDPSEVFDFLVIGGGATGIGIALDASTRGYRVALFEQSDFTKGTSSRSTKLVHGGVRYLAQGDVSLVLEALRERGLLRQNAPHLVKDQTFLIPCYRWWEGPFYTVQRSCFWKSLEYRRWRNCLNWMRRKKKREKMLVFSRFRWMCKGPRHRPVCIDNDKKYAGLS